MSTKYIDIIVNSRFRNKELYIDQSMYNMDMDLSNYNMDIVDSVQVINPTIPLSRPLINNTCNQIGIIDFLQNHIIVYIPNGDYKKDPVVLCDIINSEMVRIVDQEFSMEYNENTCKYSIMSNKDFSVLWGEHSQLSHMLGFEQETHDASIDFDCGRFKIAARYIHDLDTYSCIQLVIPQISNLQICVVTKGSVICPEIPIKKELNSITCCFVDENNVSYDFQNHDHIFMLRFKLSSHI